VTLYASIYTIDRKLFEGEADSITLPGSDGELGVLPTHIPLITALQRGTIKIRQGTKNEFIDIIGGFVEVQPESRVVILAA